MMIKHLQESLHIFSGFLHGTAIGEETERASPAE